MPQFKYRTIAISDIHLGSVDSKAELLNNFLKANTCEHLLLVGDIVDGWQMKKKLINWPSSHVEVVHQLLRIANSGTTVEYIVGNHDEFLRPFIKHDINFGTIKISNHVIHVGATGRRFLVIHGDMFDGISSLAPWLSYLGDTLYNLILRINSKFNALRHYFGMGYWSISKFLKFQVKSAVNFLFQFEQNVSNHARNFEVDGVICGHIHHLEIKKIDTIWYLNSGDWVESCSALLETFDGEWAAIMISETGNLVQIASLTNEQWSSNENI